MRLPGSKASRLGFALGGALVAALSAQPAKKGLEPDFLAMEKMWPSGGASQFLGADRAGRVSFFRGSDLSVIRQLPNGTFGAPSRMEATAEAANHVLGAALSLSGDRWLVRTGDSLRLFVNGKEKLLTQPRWHPWSIGFVGDTPVAAVIPLRAGPTVAESSKHAAVPWLVAFDGAKWSPLVEHRDLTAGEVEEGRTDLNALIARQAVVLSAARDGKLWVGNQYSYQVRRYSGAGKKLLELKVDGGKVVDKEAQSPEQSGRLPPGARAFTASPVIRGLSEGRDGLLYLVVSPAEDGRLVLDRYDSSRGVVERSVLPKIQVAGSFSLAAGKDGLYFASISSKVGRWRVTWEALANAPWREVKNVEMQGGGR